MIIDLTKLKQKSGAHEEVSFREDMDQDLLVQMGASFLEPVKVDIRLENTGRIITGQGSLTTVVLLNCSRCLKEIQYPVKGELNLAIAGSKTENHYSSDTDDIILLDGDKLDITPYVEERLFWEIPIQPLCREDCKGICPGCGANLNYEKCCCKDDDIDPRWEKLKKLK